MALPILVLKKDGRRQPFDPSKITARIERLVPDTYKPNIDVTKIVNRVERSLTCITSSAAIDHLLAEKSAELTWLHPHYDLLGGSIALDILHGNTPSSFSQACHELAIGAQPILTSRFMCHLNGLRDYVDILADAACQFDYTLSAVRALENLVLLKKNGVTMERPQYMFLRVAIALHGNNIMHVSDCFDHLLHHIYMLSTTILANAGTTRAYLIPSYSMSICEFPSTPSLYNTLAQTAVISSTGGGIGINLNNVASIGSDLGTAVSHGLPPIMELFDASLSVNLSNDCKKPQAMMSYLEPWHSDIFLILNMIRDTYSKSNHLNNLSLALWIPDLFMQRARDDAPWTLFSPSSVPLLINNFGMSFETTYVAYEANSGLNPIVVSARSLLNMIQRCQLETGGPAMLYKDNINSTSNHSNLGVITQSNLSAEIMQFTSPNETAVTIMGSVVLPSFVKNDHFDFDKLHSAVGYLTLSLNMAINETACPTPQASEGNYRQRAVGIGIQGLADTFIALDLPYDSEDAKEINFRIAQTIYHGSLTASVAFAQTHGCYAGFLGSPLSRGLFQFDLWFDAPDNNYFNWDALRQEILTHGVANSVLICMMPTAGTTQFTNCSESFQPILSNLLTKHIGTSEYRSILPALVNKLIDIGLWTNDIRSQILKDEGSVQGVAQIPNHIKSVFRNVWEVGYESVIDLAVARAPFCCQSQSLIIYMNNPSMSKLNSMHYLTWRHHLKTGVTRLHFRTTPDISDVEFVDVLDTDSSMSTDSTDSDMMYSSSNDSDSEAIYIDFNSISSTEDSYSTSSASTSSSINSILIEDEDDLISYISHSDSPPNTELHDSNIAYRRSTSFSGFSDFDEFMQDSTPDIVLSDSVVPVDDDY